MYIENTSARPYARTCGASAAATAAERPSAAPRFGPLEIRLSRALPRVTVASASVTLPSSNCAATREHARPPPRGAGWATHVRRAEGHPDSPVAARPRDLEHVGGRQRRGDRTPGTRTRHDVLQLRRPKPELAAVHYPARRAATHSRHDSRHTQHAAAGREQIQTQKTCFANAARAHGSIVGPLPRELVQPHGRRRRRKVTVRLGRRRRGHGHR